MAITAQQARAELARRELEKRSIGEDTISKSPSFIDQVKRAFMDTPNMVIRGVAEPFVKSIGTAGLGINDLLRGGKQTVPEYDVPFPGGSIPIRRLKTLPQAVGLGLQAGAMALPGTLGKNIISGAMYGGGKAMEERKNAPEIAGQAVGGAALGGVLGHLLGSPTGATGKVLETGAKVATKPFKPIGRSVKKYQTLRKGSQFEGVRQDLTPLERVSNLESKAKIKYGEPLAQEETLLKQTLGEISAKEKVVLEKSNIAIKESKQRLSESIDNLSVKMKEETTHLRDNIELASQKSAVEGKRRFGQFTKENSNSYGTKLDDVIEIAEKEGALPTKQTLQDIFDKTDAEIASTFIDTGVPLTKYNALKDKYLGSFSSEVNPEAQAISKALGFKKGQMKNAGIDWSRVDIAKSQIKTPAGKEFINLKELLQDIRSVKKAISAKGQGAERAFTDEDLVSIIFQKNVGEYMSSTYPQFAKLQKSYAPIIEQMKAGRKIFKPGAPYELGTAPKVISAPDIIEKKLIGELEKGTPGFSKGLGEISQPVIKAQKKLAGTEKGYEIAKQRIEKLNAVEQKELGELLSLREEAYKMAKEKTTVKSMVRQKQIKDQLEKRLQDLETGSFKGKETISKLTARAKITNREKKIATGGGIAAMVDYIIRRYIAKGILQ